MHTDASTLAFRKALSIFPTGVTVVTAFSRSGEKTGITVNSFNSVSLNPQLILWSIDHDAPEFDVFATTDYFCINVLSEDQVNISTQFANPYHNKFQGIETLTGQDTLLSLKICAARFECKTWRRYEGGDHMIIVGEVLRFERSNKRPLLFVNGDYAKIANDSDSSKSP